MYTKLYALLICSDPASLGGCIDSLQFILNYGKYADPMQSMVSVVPFVFKEAVYQEINRMNPDVIIMFAHGIDDKVITGLIPVTGDEFPLLMKYTIVLLAMCHGTLIADAIERKMDKGGTVIAYEPRYYSTSYQSDYFLKFLEWCASGYRGHELANRTSEYWRMRSDATPPGVIRSILDENARSVILRDVKK